MERTFAISTCRSGLHLRAKQDEYRSKELQDHADRTPHEPSQEQRENGRGKRQVFFAFRLKKSRYIVFW